MLLQSSSIHRRHLHNKHRCLTPLQEEPNHHTFLDVVAAAASYMDVTSALCCFSTLYCYYFHSLLLSLLSITNALALLCRKRESKKDENCSYSLTRVEGGGCSDSRRARRGGFKARSFKLDGFEF